MTVVASALGAQLWLALAAVLAAVLLRGRARSIVAGGLCAALGAAGAFTGALVVTGHTGALTMAVTLGPATGSVALAPEPLGGFFLVVAGVVGAVAAIFGIGYAHGPAASRTGWAAFAVFLLGLQAVPAAGDVVAFLLAWEVMAIGSSVLVFADHAQRRTVRSAGLWYAVMTHLSFVFVLVGFAVLVAEHGVTGFAELAARHTSAPAASIAFVLLALGFATKAGLVPLHVWLPRAHPEAPSHVSAVMSAAMVKMGVYGILLTMARLLPGGERWWGLALLALALPSALYGILQASVASDLKRLLAYSTTENVGLVLTAVAVWALLDSAGLSAVAAVALLAAFLLVASHAAFKTVLFLGAGAILHATGERDLDRLGGLAAGMPWTAAAFGIGALGAAALPVTSGFVAEWVLLQALIHGDGRSDRLVAVLLPVTVGVVALTAGLALLTFVKAYGIAFLARPRSEGALAATDVTASMRIALALGAFAVLALGFVPGPLADWAARAGGLEAAAGADGVGTVGAAGIDLPAVQAVLDPMALTGLGLVVTLPVALVSWRLARAIPRRPVDLPWGCGGVRVSPRMQYTATSFAEPLVRVFDDALRPTRDLEVTHAEESRYLVESARFSQTVTDVVEERVFRPSIGVLDRLGDAARRVQNGSIHRYLGFSFAALVLVLLVVAR